MSTYLWHMEVFGLSRVVLKKGGGSAFYNSADFSRTQRERKRIFLLLLKKSRDHIKPTLPKECNAWVG